MGRIEFVLPKILGLECEMVLLQVVHILTKSTITLYYIPLTY